MKPYYCFDEDDNCVRRFSDYNIGKVKDHEFITYISYEVMCVYELGCEAFSSLDEPKERYIIMKSRSYND